MSTDPAFSNPTVPAQPGQMPAPQMQSPGYLADDFWEQPPRGSPFMKFALITLKDDEGDASGGAVAVTFRRAGPDMILTSAGGTSLDSPRPPLGMAFQPSADAAYTQAQGRFCPSLPGL